MWEPCRKQKLDAYLAEVFKQFISIKDYDLKRAQEVFTNVFDQVKQKMKKQCNYFDKYCTEVLYAGSVYDGTKVTQMDEFDMDIVVGLPINFDEIILENNQPGFLLLKITDALDNLDKQPHWEKCHKITRDWRDSDKYLLQNKVRNWLQGVMTRAINDLRGQVLVNGVVYVVTYKESGPAFTLQIRNAPWNVKFQLDVDVVPVIRFQHPKWPKGYKKIQGLARRDWFVVPKPNPNDALTLKNRCWRLSFQTYEKEMMKGSHALKTTIKLVKKLRDSLELKCIASYYIKTLFLWEIDQAKDKGYWCNKLSIIFCGMVEKLYHAVKDRKIMYFWHPDKNLLEGVSSTLLETYELKLRKVLGAIYSDDCEKFIGYLLTTNELVKFKSSEFYKEFSGSKTTFVVNESLSNQCSVQISLQPPRAFQYENNSAMETSGWEKWKRSFIVFYEACELSKKETKVQLNILLHVIGDQCREMYDQFGEEFDTVEELLLKFDQVFSPKMDVTVERHRFFTRDQKDTESMEQYAFELNKIAVNCEFKELCEDLVRDRLTCGIKDVVLRETLLREVNLTSSKAIGICRLAEISSQAVSDNTENTDRHEDEASVSSHEMDQNSSADVHEVPHGSDGENDDKTLDQVEVIELPNGETLIHSSPGNVVEKCTWCGTSHRRGECPSYGHMCTYCKNMNHFAEVCWFRSKELADKSDTASE